MFVSCFVLMWRKSNRLNNIHMLYPKTRRPVYENNLFVFTASVVIVPLMFNHTRSCRLLWLIHFFFLHLITYFTQCCFFSSFRQQASLPANQGMRPIQSPRPYTTYELDQIRQFQKRFDRYFLLLVNLKSSFDHWICLVSSLAMKSAVE